MEDDHISYNVKLAYLALASLELGTAQPQLVLFFFLLKKQKVLRIASNVEKIDQTISIF
jgi:hypothetical protein